MRRRGNVGMAHAEARRRGEEGESEDDEDYEIVFAFFSLCVLCGSA